MYTYLCYIPDVELDGNVGELGNSDGHKSFS